MGSRQWGKRSAEARATLHPDLQRLFDEVLKWQDCTIIEGHRNKETQDEYYRTGRSMAQFPESKHNRLPSLAADVIPYPFSQKDWADKGKIYMFIGRVRQIADQLGIKIRCGADWDGDGNTKDQNFHDLPHFELAVSGDGEAPGIS